MASAYMSNLIGRVLDASYGRTWEEAVKEWKIIDREEDEQYNAFCLYGKEHIQNR